jgi:hypothetical protein
MNFRADLHMHSLRSFDVNSDTRGKTVRALTDYIAKANTIGVFSVTEHDSFNRDYHKDCKYASQKGLILIPGVEIDVSVEGGYRDAELLAYFPPIFNSSNIRAKVRELMSAITVERKRCNRNLLERLVEMEELHSKVLKQQITSKAQIAELLVKPSYTFNNPCASKVDARAFIADYIDETLTRKKPDSNYIADWVRKLGGRTFVPHGKMMIKGREKISADGVIELAKVSGADGVECIYPYFSDGRTSLTDSDNMCEELLELTLKNDFLVSGGNDYHGDNGRSKVSKPGNLYLPEKYTKILLDELGHKY